MNLCVHNEAKKAWVLPPLIVHLDSLPLLLYDMSFAMVTEVIAGHDQPLPFVTAPDSFGGSRVPDMDSPPQVMPEPQLPPFGRIIGRYWLSLSILLSIVVAGVIWFLGAFNDKGYAPAQPITYSHKLHAGDLHIDCLYCHFNADRGKHAGVPPTQVCMGCHTQVAVNKPDIKTLASIVEKGSYTDTDGIIHEGGAVHWNRVHKLPDHVYFSHQWHVKANVACQTCHGPVERMEVVRQFAPMTMGWCLDCHRKSNYVGGPAYTKEGKESSDANTFTVGTANYDVIRRRQMTDPEVFFHERHVKGDSAKPEGSATASENGAAHHTDKHANTEATPSILAKLTAQYPHLPRWRLADLPETHREFYKDLFDARGDALSTSFMNAATQCSTCHQ